MKSVYFDKKDILKLRDMYRNKLVSCNDLMMKKSITNTLIILEGVINSYHLSLMHVTDKFQLADMYYDIVDVVRTHSNFINNFPKFYDSIIDINSFEGDDYDKSYRLKDVVGITRDFYSSFSKSSGISSDFLFNNFINYHKFTKTQGFGLKGVAYMLDDTRECYTISLYDKSLNSVFTLAHELAHCLEFKSSLSNSSLFNDRISNEFFAYFMNLCLLEYLSTKVDVSNANSLLGKFHDDYSLMYMDLLLSLKVAYIVAKNLEISSFQLFRRAKKELSLGFSDVTRLSNVGIDDVINLESIKYAISLFDLYLVDPEKALYYIKDYLNSNLITSLDVVEYMKNSKWMETDLSNYKRTLVKGF